MVYLKSLYRVNYFDIQYSAFPVWPGARQGISNSECRSEYDDG
jgi:hypothetical protein